MPSQIMVVDDEPDIAIVLTKMLEGNGYGVHAFTDPVKALEHAKICKECEITISDVRMPHMNGFQFVKTLKAIHKEMKVILMSAFEIDPKEWRRVIPNVEVDQFLIKPLKTVQLLETVEKCAPTARQ